VFGGVIICSALAAFLFSRAPVSFAYIYQDGELTVTADLNDVLEPYMFYATGIHGTNVINIDHGRISVFAASCADLTCVRQGWVGSGRVPIVCLPNRLVVTFEDGYSDKGVDAVVG